MRPHWSHLWSYLLATEVSEGMPALLGLRPDADKTGAMRGDERGAVSDKGTRGPREVKRGRSGQPAWDAHTHAPVGCADRDPDPLVAPLSSRPDEQPCSSPGLLRNHSDSRRSSSPCPRPSPAPGARPPLPPPMNADLPPHVLTYASNAAAAAECDEEGGCLPLGCRMGLVSDEDAGGKPLARSNAPVGREEEMWESYHGLTDTYLRSVVLIIMYGMSTKMKRVQLEGPQKSPTAHAWI